MDDRMLPLDPQDYLTLRHNAEVLEADRHGDKVMRLVDGSILKVFRRKRLITSAALYPYAKRFADNCVALAARGVPCPRVRQVYRIKPLACDAVQYDPLPGITLREALRNSDQPDLLRAQFGRFLAALHEKGIYFRSAHLGNIILTPGGELGLIDCADLRARRRPLSRAMRLRNFKHVLRLKQDRLAVLDASQAFQNAYLHSQSACAAPQLAAALA
jgi:tRNA A-37 threonylcarbamoyl transferase component Bud32